MAIVFGNDIGVQPTTFESVWQKMQGDAQNALNGFQSAWDTGVIPPQPKEKVYVDGGWENVPGTAFLGSNIDGVDDVKERRVVTQEPILTVYVKKRAFGALRNENNLKLLDRGEKLFLRATKILFEKKCNQIGAYEALTKANRLISENSSVDYDLAEQVIGYLEEGVAKVAEGLAEDINGALQNSFATGSDPTEILGVAQAELDRVNADSEKVYSMIESIKEIQNRNTLLKHETTTSWVVNPNDNDLFAVGRGSGVVELTLISNLTTSLGLNASGNGDLSFSMEDPYNLTKITKDDIESALSAANDELAAIELAGTYSNLRESVASQFRGPKYYLDEAKSKEQRLNRLRATWLDQPNIIGSPAAPEIIFEVNPSSAAPNKVTGSVAGINTTFSKNDFAIVLFQQLPLDQQPDGKQVQLIGDIFQLLEDYVLASQKINSSYREANNDPDVNHARINLRKHYLGKHIVQPMDNINVYIRGNTFNENSLVGPLNSLLTGSNFVQKFQNDESVSQAVLEEEMRLLGIEDLNIPVDLYRSLRTSGSLRNAGIHVFGGIVKSVTEEYSSSNGTYTTNVRGESNLRWLDLSRVNKTPSLEQTQGVLEDPLTPYDIIIDETTGLIKHRVLTRENQRRVDAGLINHDISSENKGEKFDGTETGNAIQDTEEDENGTEIKKLKHAPGLVYKWKDGIIVATRKTNLKTPLDGSDDSSEKLRRDMGLTVVENPFAGQDAANIISIMVTGFPHNYESFYESANSIGTFNNNASSNNPQTYFQSFFDISRSTNAALGNFEPLKVIRKDPKAAEQHLSDQLYLKTESKGISQLRLQLAEFQGRLANLNQSSIVGDDKGDVVAAQERLKKSLKSIIDGLKAQINSRKEKFKKDAERAGSEVGLRLYGTDRAFQLISADSEEENRKQNMIAQRIRNSMLQIRSQYDCKFNIDKNAFIIGDEYDKDLDLQAYAISAIASQEQSLWNSQYKTPREICNEVAKTLDFEFFCDTQGNVNFRPPRYNKIPLSLLLKMLLIQQQQGVKLYPDSLASMFKSKVNNAEEEREILDLEIKIEAILLGGEWAVSKEVSKISDIVINEGQEIASEINPDTLFTVVGEDLVIDLIKARRELRSKIGGPAPDPDNESDREAAEKEILSLNDPSVPNMYVNRFNRLNKLTQMVGRRRLLKETEEKLKAQGKKFDGTGKDYLNKPNEEILATYEDLIEDDFNDLLGPGSAKRFIIFDDQIITSNFTESDNEVMVRVDVTGQEDLIGDSPGEIGKVPILWAGATDFDLWRQYGYRAEGSVNKPFFKNAENQCAPYAMMLLSRSRRNAVVGSITLYGNEYYQLGDVVYVNSRDMLYYVTSVRHNFSYSGGTFTTSLDLRYGHPLGDYILTPLDVIGKRLIKTKKEANAPVTVKKISKSLGISIGVVKFPVSASYTKDDSITDQKQKEKISMLSGDFAYNNVDNLKDALSLSKPHIGTSASDSYPKVDVRGFLTHGSSRDLVKKRMEVVKDWLQSPHGRYIKKTDSFIRISDPRYLSMALEPGQLTDNEEPVEIIKNELEDHEISRLPSNDVFNLGDIDGHIDNVIEIVMIYQEIEDE